MRVAGGSLGPFEKIAQAGGTLEQALRPLCNNAVTLCCAHRRDPCALPNVASYSEPDALTRITHHRTLARRIDAWLRELSASAAPSCSATKRCGPGDPPSQLCSDASVLLATGARLRRAAFLVPGSFEPP